MLCTAKKTIALCLLLCLILSIFVGCVTTDDPPAEDGSADANELNSETESTGESENSDGEETTDGVTECTHSYVEEVLQAPKALQDGMARYVCSVCKASYEQTLPMTKSVKILAIGNSFSVDAMEYLWNICRQGGVETVVLGNLYIGGCSLSKHWTNLSTGKADYTYYKNTNGTWSTTSNKSVRAALAEESWDIITIQQASGESGITSSYSSLKNILDYLNKYQPSEHTRILWHMTWAYQSDSTHNSFPTYQKNQIYMYEQILSCVKNQVLTQTSIDGVIPAGTAIQNLRSSYIGDTVTRDGHHLSYSHGRYTAALTWFSYITGGSVESIDWVPESYKSLSADLSVIRESVANALQSPYERTLSQAPSLTDAVRFAEQGLRIEDYRLLDWEPQVKAYWNSQNGFSLYHTGNSSSSALPYYVASRKFTKEQLPTGSVIIVDAGYQYRPEGWVNESYTASSSARPKNVTESLVRVTDAWWGSFQFRAFNVAHVGAKTAVVEGDAAHFRIYVPVS